MALPNERQHRVVHNLKTGETRIEPWSLEEWTVFEERTRLEQEREENTPKLPTLEDRIVVLEQTILEVKNGTLR